MSKLAVKPKTAGISTFLSHYKAAFLSVGIFSLVVNLLMLTGPMFMLQVYDRVLTSRSMPTLIALSLLAVGLYAFMGVLEAIRSRLLVRMGRSFDEDLSDTSFDCAVIMSVKLGRKSERLDPVRDLDTVRQFISGQGPLAIFDLPWMPAYFAIIFIFHPVLGFVAVAGGLLLLALAILNEAVSRDLMKDVGQHSVRRSGMVEAGRRNGEVLSAMGMLANLRRHWALENNSYLAIHQRASDRAALFSNLTKTIRFVMQSAVLGAGAYLVILQEITPGIMIAASIIMSRALAPVEQAVGNWRGFISARQSLNRLRAALEKFGVEAEHMELPSPVGSLLASNLSVTPPGEMRLVVQNVDFDLAAGDGLGVVGPSASGKSSLARSLVSVWPIARGEIRLDGALLEHWDRDTLGSHIGYLPQDVELFEGTVAENISRFSQDAASGRIIAAARQAGVHEIILRMPDGYDTQIGESGHALSAGQRQRIGLARALFGDPFLVVLDEPNSNLDVDGELALNAALKSVRARGGIAVVIAHRPSALAELNKVLVMSNGRQQAFGDKEQVLSQVLQHNAQTAASTASALRVV